MYNPTRVTRKHITVSKTVLWKTIKKPHKLIIYRYNFFPLKRSTHLGTNTKRGFLFLVVFRMMCDFLTQVERCWCTRQKNPLSQRVLDGVLGNNIKRSRTTIAIHMWSFRVMLKSPDPTQLLFFISWHHHVSTSIAVNSIARYRVLSLINSPRPVISSGSVMDGITSSIAFFSEVLNVSSLNLQKNYTLRLPVLVSPCGMSANRRIFRDALKKMYFLWYSYRKRGYKKR